MLAVGAENMGQRYPTASYHLLILSMSETELVEHAVYVCRQAVYLYFQVSKETRSAVRQYLNHLIWLGVQLDGKFLRHARANRFHEAENNGAQRSSSTALPDQAWREHL